MRRTAGRTGSDRRATTNNLHPGAAQRGHGASLISSSPIAHDAETLLAASAESGAASWNPPDRTGLAQCVCLGKLMPLGPNKDAGGPGRSGSGAFPASKINSKKKSGQGLGLGGKQVNSLQQLRRFPIPTDNHFCKGGRNKKAAPRRPVGVKYLSSIIVRCVSGGVLHIPSDVVRCTLRLINLSFRLHLRITGHFADGV